jgi:hypothetical protein
LRKIALFQVIHNPSVHLFFVSFTIRQNEILWQFHIFSVVFAYCQQECVKDDGVFNFGTGDSFSCHETQFSALECSNFGFNNMQYYIQDYDLLGGDIRQYGG